MAISSLCYLRSDVYKWVVNVHLFSSPSLWLQSKLCCVIIKCTRDIAVNAHIPDISNVRMLLKIFSYCITHYVTTKVSSILYTIKYFHNHTKLNLQNAFMKLYMRKYESKTTLFYQTSAKWSMFCIYNGVYRFKWRISFAAEPEGASNFMKQKKTPKIILVHTYLHVRISLTMAQEVLVCFINWASLN